VKQLIARPHDESVSRSPHTSLQKVSNSYYGQNLERVHDMIQKKRPVTQPSTAIAPTINDLLYYLREAESILLSLNTF
jgi:hypothetical protein